MNTYQVSPFEPKHLQMAQMLNQNGFKLPATPNILDALKSYDSMKKAGDTAFGFLGDKQATPNQAQPLNLAPPSPGPSDPNGQVSYAPRFEELQYQPASAFQVDGQSFTPEQLQQMASDSAFMNRFGGYF